MNHHNKNRKFGRKANIRRAFINSLALSLIVHGRIKTTEARAKELRPFIEKLVTKGKTPDLNTRRIITSRLSNREEESKKLIDEITPKYKDRKGGYTRIIKLPRRAGDASPMAYIEFI